LDLFPVDRGIKRRSHAKLHPPAADRHDGNRDIVAYDNRLPVFS
jgi:hypothetical protein